MNADFRSGFDGSALAAHARERRDAGAVGAHLIRLDSPAHDAIDPPSSDLVIGLVLGGTAGARWSWDGAAPSRTASRSPGTLGVTPVGAAGRFEVFGPSSVLIVALPFEPLRRRLSAELRLPSDFGHLHDAYGDHSTVRRLCLRLWRAIRTRSLGADLLADALTESLLVALIEASGARPPSAPGTGLSGRELARVLEAAESPDADVPALALAAAMPIRTFRRRFQTSVGTPPHRWLTLRRIEAAKTRLRNSDAPLAQLALEMGFSSQAHFSTAFARATGSSPGRYRLTI